MQRLECHHHDHDQHDDCDDDDDYCCTSQYDIEITQSHHTVQMSYIALPFMEKPVSVEMKN